MISKPLEYDGHQQYTLSEAAYSGLFSLFQPLPLAAEEPYTTDDGIVYHTTTPPRREGASHALNTFALLSPTIWLDTRPPSLVRSHHATALYTDACRFRWYYQPEPPDLDDPIATSLPPEELLSLPQYVKQRTLSLSSATRRHYAELAKLHKMEPRGQRYREGSLVSAALEAIGLGFLSLPDGYSVPPNSNKLRPGFSRRKPDRLRAWDLTRNELLEIDKHGYTGLHHRGTEPSTDASDKEP